MASIDIVAFTDGAFSIIPSRQDDKLSGIF
jgi:hypothetical protein